MLRTRRTWLLLLVGTLLAAACVGGLHTLLRRLVETPTTVAEAREHVLAEVAPRLVGEVEMAVPRAEPGSLGQVAVARFRERFARTGDLVLGSGTAPGGPVPGATAGWVEVRMTRTADPDPMSLTSVRGDPVTMCLRFEARWSASYEPRYSFQEIACPPQ